MSKKLNELLILGEIAKLLEKSYLTVNMHIHTNASDGHDTLEEIINNPQNNNDLIVVSDHDTINGLSNVKKTGYIDKNELSSFGYMIDKNGKFIVRGVELSTTDQGKSVHILGLFLKHVDQDTLAEFSDIARQRKRRLKKMTERYNQQVPKNTPINWQKDVASLITNSSCSKLNLAYAIWKKGDAISVKDALNKYLKESAPYNIYLHPAEFKLTPKEAIKRIHSWGGIAILPHAIELTEKGLDYTQKIKEYKKFKLDGLETRTSKHNKSYIENLQILVKQFKLLQTYGTDYHGQFMPFTPLTGYHMNIKYFKQIADKLIRRRKENKML